MNYDINVEPFFNCLNLFKPSQILGKFQLLKL